MEVIYLNENVLTEEEMLKLNIKSISIISESDILHPRLIVKYKDGIKKYFHMLDHIATTDEFRKFLESNLPELK